MKAIRVHEFGSPGVLKLEDIPDPQPGPDQVVVAIKAVGINPVDTYIRSGNYGKRPLPYTPGSDAAGVVEAVGEGVQNAAPGDRVYTAGTLTGAYAGKTLCKAAQVRPLPAQVSFEQGAGVFVPFYTAWYGMQARAAALSGETLLVHGASGGVGLSAVQIGRAMGMTVIGTASSDQGLELVKKMGADHALDHSKEGYLDEIKALTGSKGVEVILEMLANVNLSHDLTLLAPGGRVVVIGSRGKVEIDPRLTMSKDTSILGMSLTNATDAQMAQMHAAIGAGLDNGTLTPVVAQTFPLAEAPQAHKAVLESGAHGKIVLLT